MARTAFDTWLSTPQVGTYTGKCLLKLGAVFGVGVLVGRNVVPMCPTCPTVAPITLTLTPGR